MKILKNIFLATTFSVCMVSLTFNFLGCANDSSPLSSKNESMPKMGDLNILKLGNTTSLGKVVSSSKLIKKTLGGEITLTAGQDPELIALILQKPLITSYQLMRKLLKASPLSNTVLMVAVNRPMSMNSSHLQRVLLKNSPLNTTVLQSVIDKGNLTSQHLKKVLIASSPLPAEILDQLSTLGLNRIQLKHILLAQKQQPQNSTNTQTSSGSAVVHFKILPNSITEDVELTISLDDDEIAGEVFLTFGPHGINFNPPAILDMEVFGIDLSDVDAESINIYYVNSETGEWEPMQSKKIIVKPKYGYIKVKEARLPHFSRYALAAE